MQIQKELMIYAGKDTQMLYLQSSSIRCFFGKIPFQQIAHINRLFI